MTVWADRNQIVLRIDLVTLSNVRQRDQMVHVNVASPNLAIALSKVQITDLAPVAVIREAFGACRA